MHSLHMHSMHSHSKNFQRVDFRQNVLFGKIKHLPKFVFKVNLTATCHNTNHKCIFLLNLFCSVHRIPSDPFYYSFISIVCPVVLCVPDHSPTKNTHYLIKYNGKRFVFHLFMHRYTYIYLIFNV